jgi:DUF917 family protein
MPTILRKEGAMGKVQLKTWQDCEDFVRGCVFMGTGGGGDPERGKRMLRSALEEGLTPGWVDADDIPDDVWTTTPYGMGSIAPVTQETLDQIEQMGLEDKLGDTSMAEAIKELGDHLGHPIGCLVCCELGGGNSAAPLATGARMGIPVVDGDYAGRAVPEEMQATTFIHGKNAWPVANVDRWGNIAIIKYTVDSYMLERLGKMLAVAAFGSTTQACTPLPASEMKEVLVHGTLTKSLALGRAIREAREKSADPIDAAVEITGGWRLFEGVVSGKDWEDRDGYMFGTNHVKGTRDYEGQTLDVWFKNENHVSWLNGKPWVCSPDLIILAYKESGEGITNTQIKEGNEVVAVGIKGLEVFRTEFGLDHASGPRYFGFDIEYVPIEELMKGRP